MDRERGSLCPNGSRPGFRRVLRGAAAAIVVAVGSGLFCGTAGAAPTTTPTHGAVTPGLTLLSQSSTVASGQSFDVQLRAGTPLPSSQLGLSVAVYPCLSSVSAFDQSLSASGPSGNPISATPSPLPVSTLPTLAHGGFDLSMPVVVGDADAGGAGFTIDLASTDGQCGLYPAGVYPVRLTLTNTTTKQVVAALTTQLVYTEAAPGTQKLRVAVVLPLQLTPAPAAAPTQAELLAHPTAALSPPTAAGVSDWTAMVSTFAHSAVPVTVQASPQTVTALDDSGHQSAVNQLAAVAATPSVDQFTSTPFVPVDAAGLVDAGLSSELASQVTRGAQVLATVTHASASDSAPSGAWITNDALDDSTLSQLAADGYHQAVLPAGALSSSPQNGSAAEPFLLTTTHGSTVETLAANADLAARFTGSPGNPALAAHQLIAELAQIYYEKPNDTTARGVVALAPNDWTADPTFVSTLLGALAGNPIIQSVTTSSLFAAYGAPEPCHSGCRLVPSGGSGGLPSTSIRNQRRRINGFASAAPTARALSGALSDLVLVGETSLLHPSAQSRVLHNAGDALDAQLAQLQVGEQPITLTSLKASVPIISIESSASYPVAASVTLTSDQLLFGKDQTSQWTQLIPLHGHTTVYYVTVQTRGTGVSKVEVTLRSPSGSLELSSGEVEVRSTATSVVGIVLSSGAVVVLAVWWIRTSRKRRALRRAEEADESGSPVALT